MGLFGHKKEEMEKEDTKDIKDVAVPQPGVPSSSVQNQSSQDFSNPFAQNNDVNNTSQSMPQQPPPINDTVLNQNPQQAGNLQNSMNQNQGQDFSNPFNQNNQNPNQDMNLQQPQNEVMDQDKIQELIDETVEQVIEEKWESVTQNVQKVLNWKDKQEQQMNLIKEDIVTIRDNLEKVEKRVLNKISDYDKNILDVNSEIKALEKVFQKVTPTLINNVNELSRIAEEFRGVDKKLDDSDNKNSSST